MQVINGVATFFKRLQYLVFSAIFGFTFLINLMMGARVHATGFPAISGGSSFTAPVSSVHNINDLQLTGTGTDTTSVTLEVSHGVLDLGTSTGLSFAGATSGNKLVFNGTVNNINAALLTLHYTPDQPGADSLVVTLGDVAQVFNADNGHVYEYVQADLTWDQAKIAADAMSVGGVPGYLATITSSGESAAVLPNLTGDGWFAATDAAVEGDWRWADGPENNTLFYQGAGNSGGATVGGNYASWSPSEPNNFGSGEDCSEAYTSGLWNDLPCSMQLGYIVEFGTPGNLPTFNSSPDTKTIGITSTTNTVTVNNCDELIALDDNPGSQYNSINLANDIDCTGKTVVPLFNGMGSYQGTFDGHNHKITNVTISDENYGLGIFATTNGATIKNLKLETGSIEGFGNLGALIGNAYETNIENVHSDYSVTNINGDSNNGGLVGYYEAENGDYHIQDSSATGKVTGTYQTGGLIGYAYAFRGSITINNVNAPGDVEPASDQTQAGFLGGLVGEVYADESGHITLDKCFATGNITADISSPYLYGGLIGYIRTYTESNGVTVAVNNCYAKGNVYSPSGYGMGGLVGYVESYSDSSGVASDINIQNTYAAGDVTGDQAVGGLIGYIDNLYNLETAEVTNSFAAGHVIGTDTPTTNGLIGFTAKNGTIPAVLDGNYYDATRTGQDFCTDIGPDGCTPIDTSSDQDHFKNNNSNAPMSTWDFVDIWKTNTNDYPTFGSTAADDADGIPTHIEAAAPNSGDANNDGTPDSEQANVSSFVDSVNNKYVTLEAPSLCDITQASTAAESSNSTKDSGYDYPAGLMNFTASCGTPGYTATINQYYYGVTSANFVVRKYNPNTHAYVTVPGATITKITIGGQAVTKVTYQVKDGGSLDTDGIENGIIVDPAGLAVSAVSAPNTGLEFHPIYFK